MTFQRGSPMIPRCRAYYVAYCPCLGLANLVRLSVAGWRLVCVWCGITNKLLVRSCVSVVMALDTMAWTLIGSQGRYRLATVIVCLVSWFVTLPFAALFSLAWNVNLEGQMTAFITGYLCMGVAHSYCLLTSNWDKLSETVMESQEAELLLLRDDDAPNNNKPSKSTSSATGLGSRQFPMDVEVCSSTPTSRSNEAFEVIAHELS